jgi:hypothetical protein
MFPIESSSVVVELQAGLQVFGVDATSTNGHNGHRLGVDHQMAPGRDRDAPAPGWPADRELVDLRHKLATLPAIEQAKGMLMSYYGINATVAFEVLRRWSMSNNLKLSTLCATLVAEAGEPSEQPCQGLRQAIARWEIAR